MGDQIYWADRRETQADGAVLHRNHNFGLLAKIDNCRLAQLEGDMRRTCYATGPADTYFSIPAVCRIAGKRVKGYFTSDDDGCIVFHHCYY